MAYKLRILLCLFASTAMASVTEQPFGELNGHSVRKFTLRNSNNQEVDVISYGAIITGVRTPDSSGVVKDVALGFDTIQDYVSAEKMYFGATIGRVSNRIGGGSFELHGVRYNVSRNAGKFILHGGEVGWSMKHWDCEISGDSVVMKLLSPDGDQGFPGNVSAVVKFELSDDGELRMTMSAKTDKATPIVTTNHSYFNLAGHGANSTDLYQHTIRINADRYTVTDSDQIPTGELRSVEGRMDLRSDKLLESVIGKGYDDNFCVNGEFVARVSHPCGRYLEVRSNQPGVQFYTANNLPVPDGLAGKEGARYLKHGSFCLETQNYPDAVNHDNFPNAIVEPNEEYLHIVTYKFGVQ